MADNEEKKNKLEEFIEKHPKTVFSCRVVLWALCAAILPFLFIAFRYGIFKQDSKMQISGWGIIAVIIVAVFVISLIKYIIKALKPGFIKQCVTGFIGIIIPLVALVVIIHNIKDNMALLEQTLICVTFCELVAIPLNPFPARLEKRRIEQGIEKAENLSEIFWGKFFNKKDDK